MTLRAEAREFVPGRWSHDISPSLDASQRGCNGGTVIGNHAREFFCKVVLVAHQALSSLMQKCQLSGCPALGSVIGNKRVRQVLTGRQLNPTTSVLQVLRWTAKAADALRHLTGERLDQLACFLSDFASCAGVEVLYVPPLSTSGPLRSDEAKDVASVGDNCDGLQDSQSAGAPATGGPHSFSTATVAMRKTGWGDRRRRPCASSSGVGITCLWCQTICVRLCQWSCLLPRVTTACTGLHTARSASSEGRGTALTSSRACRRTVRGKLGWTGTGAVATRATTLA